MSILCCQSCFCAAIHQWDGLCSSKVTVTMSISDSWIPCNLVQAGVCTLPELLPSLFSLFGFPGPGSITESAVLSVSQCGRHHQDDVVFPAALCLFLISPQGAQCPGTKRHQAALGAPGQVDVSTWPGGAVPCSVLRTPGAAKPWSYWAGTGSGCSLAEMRVHQPYWGRRRQHGVIFVGPYVPAAYRGRTETRAPGNNGHQISVEALSLSR